MKGYTEGWHLVTQLAQALRPFREPDGQYPAPFREVHRSVLALRQDLRTELFEAVVWQWRRRFPNVPVEASMLQRRLSERYGDDWFDAEAIWASLQETVEPTAQDLAFHEMLTEARRLIPRGHRSGERGALVERNRLRLHGSLDVVWSTKRRTRLGSDVGAAVVALWKLAQVVLEGAEAATVRSDSALTVLFENREDVTGRRWTVWPLESQFFQNGRIDVWVPSEADAQQLAAVLGDEAQLLEVLDRRSDDPAGDPGPGAHQGRAETAELGRGGHPPV